MVGIDPESEGLARARKLGLETSAEGADWLLGLDEKPDLLFEATSAYVHRDAAPKYAEAGIRAIDLTPAAVGPGGDPAGEPARASRCAERQHDHLRRPGDHPDRLRGVARRRGALRARSSHRCASVSAGPGTRANIDEFTKTTSKGVETIGGAKRGKAIIILNPADPPMIMRDTIFCAIPEGRRPRRDRAVHPRRRRRGADLRARLPAAQRAAVRRPVDQLRRPGAGHDVRRSGGCGRLPAALRWKPGHHDRGSDQGRRGDRERVPVGRRRALREEQTATRRRPA